MKRTLRGLEGPFVQGDVICAASLHHIHSLVEPLDLLRRARQCHHAPPMLPANDSDYLFVKLLFANRFEWHSSVPDLSRAATFGNILLVQMKSSINTQALSGLR